MSTTRLRKTFHYPADTSDSDHDDLDEQEQEEVITNLRTRDEDSTQFYRKVFLPLPILASLIYLPSIFTFHATRRDVFIALLAISAMISTAWILWFFPPKMPPRADYKGKRPMYAVQYQAEGPIEEYLPILTGALVVTLAMVGMLAWKRDLGAEAWRCWLPSIVFGIVMFARRQMAPLDVEGLERLRYVYKGA